MKRRNPRAMQTCPVCGFGFRATNHRAARDFWSRHMAKHQTKLWGVA